MISKATFTAALKRAQEVQGTYKIEQSRCDALYDDLRGEDEQAVLDALKRLRKTDKTISYFNIMAFIDEGKRSNVWQDTPLGEPATDEEKQAIKEMIAKLHEKFKG